MTAPKRIQMSRQHPWRAENPDAIIVARPSKWGNPFTVAGALTAGFADTKEGARKVAVDAFRDWLDGDTWAAGSTPEWDFRRLRFLADLSEIAGHDLLCWCPLDQPCHADVLLKLASGDAS